jgi:transcriptional regulator with XRE-family HTH domain
MSVKLILARNLRLSRQQRGWSQEELAHRARVNRGNISDLETERHYARLDRLEMIAGALEIPVHQLLDPDLHASEA